MISTANKTTLTTNNVAHLTIGVKLNLSFMRNNSFYEIFLKFSNFSSQIEKMCTFWILATVFAQITNLKMQICFLFQCHVVWKFQLFEANFRKVILEKCFWDFLKMSQYFWYWSSVKMKIYRNSYFNKILLGCLVNMFFNLQSFTKYLGLILVFMWNGVLREKFNFCFSRVFR